MSAARLAELLVTEGELSFPRRSLPDYGRTGNSPKGRQPCSRDGLDDVRMAGMRGEFITFYDREHQLLIRFLMNAGASLPAAQDAMQEAFVDGWALVQSGEWDGLRNPAGWIRVVGLRKYYRLRGQAGREVFIPDFAEAPPPGPCPADLAAEALAVLAALYGLPPDERVALAFQIDGFSCRETAKHLGITEQQARDLRKKARRNYLASNLDAISARRRTL
jgi:DNA-directed RNA polymerase specialized sigma24 family protein